MNGGLPHVTVGLWLDSWIQPAWRVRALRLLLARPDVRIAYASVAEPSPLPARAGRKLNGLLRWLLRQDHRRAIRFCPDAFAPEDARTLLNPVPVVSPVAAPVSVDVLMQFGRATASAAHLAAARAGAWRYGADPGHLLDELPVGFWDVVEGRETVATVLQEGGGNRAIHRRIGATALGSVVHTAMQALWRQSGDLAIKLGQLAALGWAALDDTPAAASVASRPAPPPGVLRTAALWARHTVRVARRWAALRGVQYQWHLLAAPCGDDPRGQFDLARYEVILPPPDRLWADPFPVVHDGRTFVFIEEQRFEEPFGHVSVMEVHPDRSYTTPRQVLARPYHLSYPFVFRWADQWYLLPESLAGGRLELLRATAFPYEWETDRILLDHGVADATLAPIDGQWWMFAANWPAPDLDCDELHLYRADSPLGPWTPHPRNPVRSDVRCTRPAGRLVFHDGSWWRPVQDGAKRYGYAVRWHRIIRLDDHGLEEEPGPVLRPTGHGGLLGVHTMNTAGAVCFADGLHVIPPGRRAAAR